MVHYTVTFVYPDEPLGTSYLHKTLEGAHQELMQTIDDLLEEYKEEELNPTLIMINDDKAIIKDDNGEWLAAIVVTQICI